jgi:chemotaxis protein histidine kinase CheA
MSDSRTELVEQFVIETQQHIDEIEPMLLAAEWEIPDKQTIGGLFRRFHSIKGLSRLLELRGLETVTHHAESLLGEVRSGRLRFTPAIQDLLLQAYDAIRTLRERSIASGQDAPAPAPISRPNTTERPSAISFDPLWPPLLCYDWQRSRFGIFVLLAKYSDPRPKFPFSKNINH